MANQDHTSPNTPAPDTAAKPTRKRALLGLTGVFAVAGIAYGTHWTLVERYRIETDNAYVQGNVVQITPQIGGTVLAINVDDTDYVQAGQPLVRLDPTDAQVALDQAEAQLAQTVREVRTTYANNGTLAANIALRQAEVARAQADVAKAEDDVARRRPLVVTGAVGKEELQHADTALSNAKAAAAASAALAAAREQLTSNQSLTDGTSVENHPNVQKAAARVREAYLALQRSDIPAPVGGYVAKRSVQVGQRVQAGAPMMAIIPLDQVWVDANFKESQLRNMRIVDQGGAAGPGPRRPRPEATHRPPAASWPLHDRDRRHPRPERQDAGRRTAAALGGPDGDVRQPRRRCRGGGEGHCRRQSRPQGSGGDRADAAALSTVAPSSHDQHAGLSDNGFH